MQKQLVVDECPLAEAQIQNLQKGYDRESLRELGKKFLSQPYKAILPWAEFVMDHQYNEDHLHPQLRELVLIALLTSRKEVGTVAIHIYWAIMEGVSPAEIAHTIALTGTYTGLDNYVIGIRAYHQTLAILAEQACKGEEERLTEAVLTKLIQLFPA